MKRFLLLLKKEFLEMLPPAIFFFVTFSLLLILRKFMNFDHNDARVCTVVLEIMLLLALFSGEGHAQVMESMDVFREEKEEPLPFFSLVECMRSDQDGYSMQFKAYVLSFLNTLINLCPQLEQRVSLRSDLVYLGFFDVLARRTDKPVKQ